MKAASEFQTLSLASIEKIPIHARPLIDPRSLQPKVLHFGLGAFHRAHQAVYTERSNLESSQTWGIIDIAPTSTESVEAMKSQDCLYSVTERATESSTTHVVGSVIDALHLKKNFENIIDHFKSDQISNLTMTITEKGYYRDSETRRLKLSANEISCDLDSTQSNNKMTTVVGTVAYGLLSRFRNSGAPINLISCDNMTENGIALSNVIGDFIRESSWVDKGQLLEWMSRSVAFPSTVVDQIVPPTTSDDRKAVAGELGFYDEMAVFGEPYRQWVLEDCFVAPRPQWELAGAQIVQDAAPYQLLKLRLLNGSHSMLAYLGLASGLTTISETLESPWGEKLLRAYALEVAPTLTISAEAITNYVNALVTRFSNPAMKHQLQVIGSDGTLKLPERLLGSIRSLIELQKDSYITELAVAGWVNATKANSSGQQQFGTTDPLAAKTAQCWINKKDSSEVVRSLLQVIGASDLSLSEKFVSGVVSQMDALSKGQIQL